MDVNLPLAKKISFPFSPGKSTRCAEQKFIGRGAADNRMPSVRHHVTHNRHYGALQNFAAAIFIFFDKSLLDSSKSPVDANADKFSVISCDDHLVVG